MEHQRSQPSVPQCSHTLDYLRVLIPVDNFRDVRARVLDALKAQPKSVDISSILICAISVLNRA